MSLLQIHEPGQTPEPHATPVKPAIGIDLGTTHSVVAFSHRQEVAVFSDDAGHTITPSVLADVGGELIVGHEARAAQDAVASVKRLMGRSIRDIATEKNQLPFTLVDRGDDVIRIQLGNRVMTPVEISGHILRHMRGVAESAMECPLSEAVITVPAYFDDAARTATRDAARLAGLEVLRLINEPTAAALAYGLDSEAEGCFAIYDFGGGTFDISILKLHQGVFQVLATGGHTQLGGDDIDRAILEQIGQQSAMESTPESQRHGLSLARSIKEALSTAEDITIENITFTRSQLEACAAPLIADTLAICERALSDAGLAIDQIDGVVLVGGSTRMPLVRAEVERFFGKRPLGSIDPDEVVAVGAAIQAEALTRGANHLLLDVTPLSLGLETMGGIVEKIIHRNTPIPISTSQEFTTYQDGQSAMKIHVLQGERELVDQCRSLAEFVLTGIPPLPANLARIRVTFTVDADGLLTVTAREMTSGVEQHVEVKPSYGLPIEQIEAMLRDSMLHAESDIMQRLLIESRVEAQRVIHDIQAAIRADRELLSDVEHDAITQAISQLEQILHDGNREAVDAQTQQLNELTNPFAARRMDKAIASALEGTHIDQYPHEVEETHA